MDSEDIIEGTYELRRIKQFLESIEEEGENLQEHAKHDDGLPPLYDGEGGPEDMTQWMQNRASSEITNVRLLAADIEEMKKKLKAYRKALAAEDVDPDAVEW